VLVLNALVRKSSDLLEFNQKHNAAIFSSKVRNLLYWQARSQGGHLGAVLPVVDLRIGHGLGPRAFGGPAQLVPMTTHCSL